MHSATPTSNSAEFTGRENDGNGLYYYRARFYTPVPGRFVSEDPIGWRGGANLYKYVMDDPTDLIDPLGYGPLDCARWLYDYRRCANSIKKCREDLDKKYPNLVDLCIETKSNNQDDAYFKECFLKNPECQPLIKAGAECGIWPHGGLLKFLRELFGR